MNTVSKLLASSIVVLTASTIAAPIMAAGTESFNLAINMDNEASNTLVLTSSISANNTFNGDGTDYPLVGEMDLTGFNIQGVGCKLLFTSQNESDTSFRMINDAEEYVNYALSVNLLTNNSGNNTSARLLNRSGANATRAVTSRIGDDSNCSLNLSDFAVKLEKAASELTGVYRDTVTVTASVTS